VGVCFNGGRLLAAPLLWVSGELKALPGVDLRLAVTILSSLFFLGLVLLLFLPETKGKPLPQDLEGQGFEPVFPAQMGRK
jgi:hypothetical protein